MTSQDYTTTTDRLALSPLDPSQDSHCDFIVALYNTPEFIATNGGKSTSITTREASRKYIQNRFLSEYARNGYGTYLVSLKPSSTTDDPAEEAKYIGTISLSMGPPPDNPTIPDLGFAILPEYMRQGYATEAAKALMAWAEREKGVKEVLGLFDPGNEGSRGVFRRLGFVERGVRRLKAFGGVEGSVWVMPGMDQDLESYGL